MELVFLLERARNMVKRSTYGFEQELHNYLAEYSVGGEWYKFDEAKVEEIRAYINSL